MALTAERKREIIKANFKNPYKVGDVLHHSWGYEQTNCDFYQVMRVTRAGVTLAKIESRTVPGSDHGGMCDLRMPVKDCFVLTGGHALSSGSPRLTADNHFIQKRVSCLVEDNGTLRYFIHTDYGFCDLWNGDPQTCSWYG